VDELADGRRVLLDYKTGEVKKGAWEGERPDEPQLPLYAVTEDEGELAAVAFAQTKTGDMRFRGVQSESGILPGRVDALANMSEQVGDWRRVLTMLAEDFRNGLADADPKRGKKTCAFCGLPALCRIAEAGIDQLAEESDD